MFSGKRVFVSGGAGVIGRALVSKLVSQGAIVFVGDLQPRPREWPSSVLYRQGDLNLATEREICDFEPQYFFHLAATFERSTETYEFWDENYYHNVRLSHHLMTLLKNCQSLEKVIFASSYLVYDSSLYTFKEPAKEPVRLGENERIRPRNICGAAKLLHEAELGFLSSFPETHYEVVAARIFRSYGRGSRDIISRWVRCLLKQESIDVYSEEGLFDYIFADEVAEGLMRFAHPGIKGVVNLGNDNARRVSDVVRVVQEHFPDVKINRQKSDIQYEASQADMDLCRQITKWSPQKQLEDAIPELIQFEHGGAGNSQSEGESFNVLVTSVSSKIPLLRELRKAINKLTPNGKIFGADMNEQCLARYFVDAFWVMPPISSLSIDDLISYCSEHKIKAIIPTRDGELSYFAEHQQLMENEKISVMISAFESVKSCVDKLAFAKTPLRIRSCQIIPTALDSSEINSSLFVVKERFGAGSRNIAIGVPKNDAVEHALTLDNPVFQPYIEGEEYSADVYISALGQVKGCVIRKRDFVVDGESQVSTTIRLVGVEEAMVALVQTLKLRGHIVLQAIVDKENNCHIIECNCRFGGASSLSLAAGLDSFYWFLLESSGEDISHYPFYRSKKELRQIRYPEDLVIHDTGF